MYGGAQRGLHQEQSSSQESEAPSAEEMVLPSQPADNSTAKLWQEFNILNLSAQLPRKSNLRTESQKITCKISARRRIYCYIFIAKIQSSYISVEIAGVNALPHQLVQLLNSKPLKLDSNKSTNGR